MDFEKILYNLEKGSIFAMSILAALYLYAFVALLLLITCCVITSRSTGKFGPAYIIGLLVSILWLPCLAAVTIVVWCQPKQRHVEDFSDEE